MYYFASDTHLGAGTADEQKATERLFVEWLERVSADATAIFLCGDIFDFWFEYKRVVPKGFVRTLGKIAELHDRGIRIVFMAGNHDMWVKEYLAEECGVELYTSPTSFLLGTKMVHIAHGDNLNVKKNFSLRLMNAFFRSKSMRYLFERIVHPDLALKFGQWWSGASRGRHSDELSDLIDACVGYLKEYALSHYEEHHDDIYLFGHLHCAKAFDQTTPQIIFMNDWSRNPYYISLDDDGVVKLCQVKMG